MSYPPSPVTLSSAASPSPARGHSIVRSEIGPGTSAGPGAASDALKKKRERDKVSQRKKRQREREYTTSLEEKVRDLEDQLARLSASPARDSLSTQSPLFRYSFGSPDDCGDARLCLDQNTLSSHSKALHQASHQQVVAPDKLPGLDEAELALAKSLPSITGRLNSIDSIIPEEICDKEDRHSSVSVKSFDAVNRNSAAPAIPFPLFEKVLNTPEWLRLPVHCWSMTQNARPWVRGDKLRPFIYRMRTDPNSQANCPPQPEAIDILYGGSKNILANLISGEVAKEALLPPEKFAISWLLYLYIRWVIWPSEETYAMLPKQLRPTPRQLAVEHPWCIDLIQWPEVRDNLIAHLDEYDIDDVVGLFLCTCRLRGFFNSNFIHRENGGELQVDTRFYQQYMTADGWGILDRFWMQYRDLVRGLDPRVMIREEHLLAI